MCPERIRKKKIKTNIVQPFHNQEKIEIVNKTTKYSDFSAFFLKTKCIQLYKIINFFVIEI